MVGEDGKQTWVCEAQARGEYPAGIITAYAVGIKDLKSDLPVPMRIPQQRQMQFLASLSVGCGARAEPGPGLEGAIDRQFLTAIFPNAGGVRRRGFAPRSYVRRCARRASASGTVSAYAINLLLDRGVLGTVYPNTVAVGSVVTVEGARVSAIVPITHFPNSVHRATITVPSLPPGPYTVNSLQSHVPGPVKGPTFSVQ